MTAKEMFEKLGFKQTLCINEDCEEYAQIEYESKSPFDEYTTIKIYFVSEGFFASLYEYDFDKEKMVKIGGCIVDCETLKAITQQMKELGWLDD